MRVKTAITKYTPTDLILAEAAAATVAPGMLAIGKRVKGVAVKQVPLWPYILLRVEVLIGGEVLVKRGVVAQARIVQEQSYIDISNIRIIKMRIAYLLNRYFSQTTSRN